MNTSWRYEPLAVARATLVLAFILAGCRSGAPVGRRQPALVPANAPAWVARGGGAFNDGNRAFYGVGAVQGIQNVGLARDAAAARARNDLARSIEVFVRSLYRDYQAATAVVGAQAASEEQLAEQAINQYTEATLSGTRIVEYWADNPAGALYALARLDFETAQEQLNRLATLSDRAQQHIRRNAQPMFDELERQGRTPR